MEGWTDYCGSRYVDSREQAIECIKRNLEMEESAAQYLAEGDFKRLMKQASNKDYGSIGHSGSFCDRSSMDGDESQELTSFGKMVSAALEADRSRSDPENRWQGVLEWYKEVLDGRRAVSSRDAWKWVETSGVVVKDEFS